MTEPGGPINDPFTNFLAEQEAEAIRQARAEALQAELDSQVYEALKDCGAFCLNALTEDELAEVEGSAEQNGIGREAISVRIYAEMPTLLEMKGALILDQHLRLEAQRLGISYNQGQALSDEIKELQAGLMLNNFDQGWQDAVCKLYSASPLDVTDPQVQTMLVERMTRGTEESILRTSIELLDILDAEEDSSLGEQQAKAFGPLLGYMLSVQNDPSRKPQVEADIYELMRLSLINQVQVTKLIDLLYRLDRLQ